MSVKITLFKRKSSFHPVLRATAALLVCAFLAQDVAHANPELKLTSLFVPTIKLDLGIPESVARVEEIGAPENQGVRHQIFLIQDAHTNPSAQFNIAEAIQHLVEKEKVKTVYVEGGFGDVSLTPYRTKADISRRKFIGEKYVRRGELSGAELYDLTSDGQVGLWGVEDEALYWKSLELYRTIAKEREKFSDYLIKLKRSVEALKPDVLHPLLRGFDAKREAFLNEKLSWTEYFEVLSKYAKWTGVMLKDYPELEKLTALRAKEKGIDFEKANKKDASEIKKYEEYQAAYKKLRMADLLREQEEIEKAILTALSENADEKRLIEIGDIVRHWKALLNLTILPDQFQFVSRGSSGDLREITSFLNQTIMDLEDHYENIIFLNPDFEKTLATAQEFYKATQERDEIFVRKTLQKMTEKGESKAVLVTGGYHSPNLKSLLKQKNVSYVSLQPQVTSETNVQRYEKLLLSQTTDQRLQIADKKSPISELLTPNSLAVLMLKNASPERQLAFGQEFGLVPGLAADQRQQPQAKRSPEAPNARGSRLAEVTEARDSLEASLNTLKLYDESPALVEVGGIVERWMNRIDLEDPTSVEEALYSFRRVSALIYRIPINYYRAYRRIDPERNRLMVTLSEWYIWTFTIVSLLQGFGFSSDLLPAKELDEYVRLNRLFNVSREMEVLMPVTLTIHSYRVELEKLYDQSSPQPRLERINNIESALPLLMDRNFYWYTVKRAGIVGGWIYALAKMIGAPYRGTRVRLVFSDGKSVNGAIAEEIVFSLKNPHEVPVTLAELSGKTLTLHLGVDYKYFAGTSGARLAEQRPGRLWAPTLQIQDSERVQLLPEPLRRLDLGIFVNESDELLVDMQREGETEFFMHLIAGGRSKDDPYFPDIDVVYMQPGEMPAHLSYPDWLNEQLIPWLKQRGFDALVLVEPRTYEESHGFVYAGHGMMMRPISDKGARLAEEMSVELVSKDVARLLERIKEFRSDNHARQATTDAVSLTVRIGGMVSGLESAHSFAFPVKFKDRLSRMQRMARRAQNLTADGRKVPSGVAGRFAKYVAETQRTWDEVQTRRVRAAIKLANHNPHRNDGRWTIRDLARELKQNWQITRDDLEAIDLLWTDRLVKLEYNVSELDERQSLVKVITSLISQPNPVRKNGKWAVSDIAREIDQTWQTTYRLLGLAGILGSASVLKIRGHRTSNVRPTSGWAELVDRARHIRASAGIKGLLALSADDRSYLEVALDGTRGSGVDVDRMERIIRALVRVSEMQDSARSVNSQTKQISEKRRGARLADGGQLYGSRHEIIGRVQRDLLADESRFPAGVARLTAERLGYLSAADGFEISARQLYPETEDSVYGRAILLNARESDISAFHETAGEDFMHTFLVLWGADGMTSLAEDPDIAVTTRYILERSAAELYPDRFILVASDYTADPTRYFAAIQLNAQPDRGSYDVWRKHPRYYKMEPGSTTAAVNETVKLLEFLRNRARQRPRAPKIFDATINGHHYRYPNISAYDFSDETLADFFDDKRAVPLVLDLHFKAPCGLRCLFCYTEAGAVDERHAIDERTFGMMGPNDIKEAIRQYASLGGHTLIILSIGEPLTDTKLFLEYAQLAQSLGVRVVTFTNMLTITEQVAQSLRKAEVNMLLKLNSLNPQVNDRLGGRDGVYRYVDHMGQKIPTQLKYVLDAYADRPDLIALSSDVTRQNMDDVLEMSRWAYEKLGVAHFRKHLYYFGFAQSNRDQVGLTETEAEDFDRRAYAFDRQYGFEYPVSPVHSDQYSFDMRRFLNNNVAHGGFPVRTFSHYVSGFYHNSSIVQPRFGFKKGLRVSVRDPATGRVDLKRFFSVIHDHVKFFRTVSGRLRALEESYVRDRQSSSQYGQIPPDLAVRHEEAYRLARDIKKYLLKHRHNLAPADKRALEAHLRRASEFARENPLYWLPPVAGVRVIPFGSFRSAFYPNGERFSFMSLHRFPAFYTHPYQSTFALTPPNSEQEIHGHFFTRELTVMLDPGGGFNLYRLRGGQVVESVFYEVPAFSAGVFSIKTPHALVNKSVGSYVRNWTVKFGRQVLDRWSLDEGPSEEEYTYEGSVASPLVTRQDGVTSYMFDKGDVIQRLIAIEPGREYAIALDRGSEKGVFLMKGEVGVARSGESLQPVGEGDVVYFVSDDLNRPMVIRNSGSTQAIIGVVDLAEDEGMKLEQVLSQSFRALMLDVDGVLNVPVGDRLDESAVERVADLLIKGVPVLLVGSRREKPLGHGYRSQARSMGEVIALFHDVLVRNGRTDLLANLLIAPEDAAYIINGFDSSDPRYKKHILVSSKSGLPSAFQEEVLRILSASGLTDEHVRVESREFGMSLEDHLEFRAPSIEWEIRQLLEKRGLGHKFHVVRSEEMVEVRAIDLSRSLAAEFFARTNGIRMEDIAVISRSGDAGGFATDISNENVGSAISLRHLSGYGPGSESFGWILDRIQFDLGARLAESRVVRSHGRTITSGSDYLETVLDGVSGNDIAVDADRLDRKVRTFVRVSETQDSAHAMKARTKSLSNGDQGARLARRVSIARITSNYFSQAKIDVARGRALGIGLGWKELGFYYLFVELLGLSVDEARSKGLDKLIWHWLQYMRVGDQLLDKFGDALSDQEVIQLLEEADRTGQIDLRLRSRVSDEVLSHVMLETVLPEDTRNRVDIVDEYPRVLMATLDEMGMPEESKAIVRNAIWRNSRLFLHSYLLERMVGISPRPESVLAIFQEKDDFRPLFDIAYVFSPDLTADEITSRKSMLFSLAYFSQHVDDYIDFFADYGWQPNLLWSIAHHDHPHEFAKLSRWVSSIKRTNYLSAQIATVRSAPNSLVQYLSVTWRTFIAARKEVGSSIDVLAAYALTKLFMRSIAKHELVRSEIRPAYESRAVSRRGSRLTTKSVFDFYFKERAFEKNGHIYEMIGVEVFIVLYRVIDLLLRSLEIGWIKGDSVQAALEDRMRISKILEVAHWILFGYFLFMYLHGRIHLADWLVSVPLNVYPIMTQRYIRHRIDRLIQHRQKSDARLRSYEDPLIRYALDKHLIPAPGESFGNFGTYLDLDSGEKLKISMEGSGPDYRIYFSKGGTVLGYAIVEIDPDRIQISSFYPLGLEKNIVDQYKDKKIGQRIVAWLALVAHATGRSMEGLGTYSAPLIHIYEKFFADQMWAEGRWMKFEGMSERGAERLEQMMFVRGIPKTEALAAAFIPDSVGARLARSDGASFTKHEAVLALGRDKGYSEYLREYARKIGVSVEGASSMQVAEDLYRELHSIDDGLAQAIGIHEAFGKAPDELMAYLEHVQQDSGARLAVDWANKGFDALALKNSAESRWPEGQRPTVRVVVSDEQLRLDLADDKGVWGGTLDLRYDPSSRAVVVESFRLRPQWMRAGLPTWFIHKAWSHFDKATVLIWPRPRDSAAGFMIALGRKGYVSHINRSIWRDRMTAHIVRNGQGARLSEGRRWIMPIAALVILIPPIILTVLWVHFIGGIPLTFNDIVFKQKRVGQGGREFTLYKLKHMRNGNHLDMIPGAEYIRRAGLDEPMQLFNIVKREMNFIGPRPVQQNELLQVSEELREEYIQKVMTKKPGLFSMMSARRGAGQGAKQMHDPESIRRFFELAILFAEYERAHEGLFLDVKILILNFVTLVRALMGREAAYDTFDKLEMAPEVLEAKEMRAYQRPRVHTAVPSTPQDTQRKAALAEISRELAQRGIYHIHNLPIRDSEGSMVEGYHTNDILLTLKLTNPDLWPKFLEVLDHELWIRRANGKVIHTIYIDWTVHIVSNLYWFLNSYDRPMIKVTVDNNTISFRSRFSDAVHGSRLSGVDLSQYLRKHFRDRDRITGYDFGAGWGRKTTLFSEYLKKLFGQAQIIGLDVNAYGAKRARAEGHLVGDLRIMPQSVDRLRKADIVTILHPFPTSLRNLVPAAKKVIKSDGLVLIQFTGSDLQHIQDGDYKDDEKWLNDFRVVQTPGVPWSDETNVTLYVYTPEDMRNALPEQDILKKKKQYGQWDWSMANKVLWHELIRDPEHERSPRDVNQENYYRNQVAVRAAMLDLIRDMASRDMPDDEFVDRIRNMHKVLLTGETSDSFYVSRSMQPKDSIAISVAGKLAYEPTGIPKLIWIKQQLDAFIRLKVDPSDRREILDFVSSFYSRVIGTNIFPYGNHSWYMQFVNTMLRLHGLRGVSHGFFDMLIEQEPGLDVAGHMREGILAVNAGARLAYQTESGRADAIRGLSKISDAIESSPGLLVLKKRIIPNLRAYLDQSKISEKDFNILIGGLELVASMFKAAALESLSRSVQKVMSGLWQSRWYSMREIRSKISQFYKTSPLGEVHLVLPDPDAPVYVYEDAASKGALLRKINSLGLDQFTFEPIRSFSQPKIMVRAIEISGTPPSPGRRGSKRGLRIQEVTTAESSTDTTLSVDGARLSQESSRDVARSDRHDQMMRALRSGRSVDMYLVIEHAAEILGAFAPRANNVKGRLQKLWLGTSDAEQFEKDLRQILMQPEAFVNASNWIGMVLGRSQTASSLSPQMMLFMLELVTESFIRELEDRSTLANPIADNQKMSALTGLGLVVGWYRSQHKDMPFSILRAFLFIVESLSGVEATYNFGAIAGAMGLSLFITDFTGHDLEPSKRLMIRADAALGKKVLIVFREVVGGQVQVRREAALIRSVYPTQQEIDIWLNGTLLSLGVREGSQRQLLAIEALPPNAGARLSLARSNDEEWLLHAGFDVIHEKNDRSFIEYSRSFEPVKVNYTLIMVPHAQTPSNIGHLFQSHEDQDPRNLPTPEGLAATAKGAEEFVRIYGQDLRDHRDQYVFLVSPLKRTQMTAGIYQEELQKNGFQDVVIQVDPDLVEINQGRWHHKTVDQVGHEDRALAQAYRAGDFFVKAGGVESRAMLMRRAYDWLVLNNKRYEGKTLVVFGHGHFQNAVETLLRAYPKKTPSQIYARTSASHLRRGSTHLVHYEPQAGLFKNGRAGWDEAGVHRAEFARWTRILIQAKKAAGERVTVKALARSMGISRQTFYNHLSADRRLRSEVLPRLGARLAVMNITHLGPDERAMILRNRIIKRLRAEFQNAVPEVMRFLGIPSDDHIRSFEIKRAIYSYKDRVTNRYTITLMDGKRVVFYAKRYKKDPARFLNVDELARLKAAYNNGVDPLGPRAQMISVRRASVLLTMGDETATVLDESKLDDQIAEAFGFSLGLLHKRGIVHNDLVYGSDPGFLKVHHILVKRDAKSRPWVSFIDFGGIGRTNLYSDRWAKLEKDQIFDQIPREVAPAFKKGYDQGRSGARLAADGRPKSAKGAMIFPSPRSVTPRYSRTIKALYQKHPLVRDIYDRAALGTGYRQEQLFLDGADSASKDVILINLANFLYSYSLFKLWEARTERKVDPGYFAGNSAGVFPALVIANAISLEDMLLYIKGSTEALVERSKQLDYAVFVIYGADLEDIRGVLMPGKIEISQDASPQYLTLVARNVDFEAILNEIRERLKGQPGAHVFYNHPPLAVSPHSSFYRTEGTISDLRDLVDSLAIRAPQAPVISSSKLPIQAIITREDVVEELLHGFFRPVHWSSVVRYLGDQGVSVVLQAGSDKRLMDFTSALVPSIHTKYFFDEDTLSDVILRDPNLDAWAMDAIRPSDVVPQTVEQFDAEGRLIGALITARPGMIVRAERTGLGESVDTHYTMRLWMGDTRIDQNEFIYGQEITGLEWSETPWDGEEDEVLTLHGLSLDEKYQNSGVDRAIVAWLAERAQAKRMAFTLITRKPRMAHLMLSYLDPDSVRITATGADNFEEPGVKDFEQMIKAAFKDNTDLAYGVRITGRARSGARLATSKGSAEDRIIEAVRMEIKDVLAQPDVTQRLLPKEIELMNALASKPRIKYEDRLKAQALAQRYRENVPGARPVTREQRAAKFMKGLDDKSGARLASELTPQKHLPLIQRSLVERNQQLKAIFVRIFSSLKGSDITLNNVQAAFSSEDHELIKRLVYRIRRALMFSSALEGNSSKFSSLRSSPDPDGAICLEISGIVADAAEEAGIPGSFILLEESRGVERQIIHAFYSLAGLAGHDVVIDAAYGQVEPEYRRKVRIEEQKVYMQRLEALPRFDQYGARLSMVGPQDSEHPYNREAFVQRSIRALEIAYHIEQELDARKDEEQSVLLIGAGRGIAAAQMALRYPHLRIVAVNKEPDLWNASIIRGYLKNAGYSGEQLDEALGRIEVRVLDIASQEDRLRLLGQDRFDMVIVETFVAMYLEKRLNVYESLFNDHLAPGGIYAIEVPNTFIRLDDEFEPRVNLDRLHELVRDTFSSSAQLVYEYPLPNHRILDAKDTVSYFKFKKTEASPVALRAEYLGEKIGEHEAGRNIRYSHYLTHGLRTFFLGAFMSFGAGLNGQAIALPSGTFHMEVTPSFVSAVPDKGERIEISDLAEAVTQARSKLSEDKRARLDEAAVRSALVRSAQKTNELMPLHDMVSPRGFVQFDLTEFESQIPGETELQDAVRLIFEVMGALGGNYYLKQSESSRISAGFLHSLIAHEKGRANITLTRPSDAVLARVVIAKSIPSLEANERLVLAEGFEGGLPDLMASARLAQEVADFYSNYFEDGQITNTAEASRSIADSRIPRAVARLAGLHQTPDGAYVADYFSGKLPVEEAMVLAVKPIRIFIELGRALKTALWTQISA